MCATAHGTTCHAPPVKTMSLRSQCAHWLWQSASPVPSAPLPKGGWHGEAVTGGFLFTPHPLQRPRRGRCPHRPAHRTPCKTPCHCEPVTDVTGVAIRNFKDPTRQKRPAPGRSFSNIPYITIYPLPRLILTPLEDLQNIVEMALLLFQLRLFLRGNALRRLLGGLLCLRGSLSGHRL